MAAEPNLAEIWGEFLAVLRSELMKPSFDLWQKQTWPVGLSGDTLVVAVSNATTLELVRNRHDADIDSLLERIVGRPISIRLVLPPTGAEAAPRGHAADEVAATTDAAPPDLIARPDTEPATDPVPAGTVFRSVAPLHRRPLLASLNPKYTFESFVVGNSNRFAHAGAIAVADSPGRAYNPLFIYGGVGLGKTHLMQAIGHQALRRYPDLAVLYVTSETFTNELINAIRDDRTMEFKNRYRSIDILLIDDIQFIAGKERTQEEFFHTFESLHGANRQVVISSDRPPREIPTLEERLRSRFEWGLLADIQAPDLETRIAILRKKALQERLPVPDDVLVHIASQIPTNIRELEGALIRIVATASLEGNPVTLEVATKALKDILPNRPHRPVTFSDIQKAVCRHFSLTLDDLRGESRARKVALPRQIAMYLCREQTGASLPKIGDEFGGRDHTTVLHACEKIGRERKEDPEIEQTIAALLAALQNPQN